MSCILWPQSQSGVPQRITNGFITSSSLSLAALITTWQHARIPLFVFGVEISTIDNPGWSVGVDLHDTHKQEATFEHVKIDRKPDDWIHYWAQKQKFQIRCGPLNLSEAIEIFARWFDSP